VEAGVANDAVVVVDVVANDAVVAVVVVLGMVDKFVDAELAEYA